MPGEGRGGAEFTAALSQARQGDEDAFRILYRRLNPELVRYARVIVGEDAEDVVSEAWLQIARDLRSFEGDGERFRRFALVVVRNRARDLLRRARSRVREVAVPGVEMPEPRGEVADAAESALETLSTSEAIAFIATLPREQAEAVLLRVVLGMDAAGAGEVLGKRPGAVRMAVSRGLRSLGRRVEQSGEYGTTRPIGSDVQR